MRAHGQRTRPFSTRRFFLRATARPGPPGAAAAGCATARSSMSTSLPPPPPAAAAPPQPPSRFGGRLANMVLMRRCLRASEAAERRLSSQSGCGTRGTGLPTACDACPRQWPHTAGDSKQKKNAWGPTRMLKLGVGSLMAQHVDCNYLNTATLQRRRAALRGKAHAQWPVDCTVRAQHSIRQSTVARTAPYSWRKHAPSAVVPAHTMCGNVHCLGDSPRKTSERSRGYSRSVPPA